MGNVIISGRGRCTHSLLLLLATIFAVPWLVPQYVCNRHRSIEMRIRKNAIHTSNYNVLLSERVNRRALVKFNVIHVDALTTNTIAKLNIFFFFYIYFTYCCIVWLSLSVVCFICCCCFCHCWFDPSIIACNIRPNNNNLTTIFCTLLLNVHYSCNVCLSVCMYCDAHLRPMPIWSGFIHSVGIRTFYFLDLLSGMEYRWIVFLYLDLLLLHYYIFSFQRLFSAG